MRGEVLIRGVRPVDSRGVGEMCDLLIGEGRILSLEGGSAPQVIEAHGLYVSPGFFDLHTHLREPGEETKEDLASGLLAALRGGYSDVVCMANTQPPIETPEQVEALRQRADRLGLARLHPAAALTRGLEGKQLTDIARLKRAGVALLSYDGHTTEDAGVLARGLRYAQSWGLMVAVHAEDRSLRGRGIMNDGALADQLGLPGNPAAAEAARIARDLEVVAEAGGRLHIHHLSTRRGLQLVRDGQARGLQISAEVTPHHLTLSEEALTTFDPIYKVAPPLRTREDLMALREGLWRGEIQAVATDHAPHTPDEKELDLIRAPFGIASLEVAFPLLYSELVIKEGFPLPLLIERFTDGPRKLLGHPPLHLDVGAEATMVLWDPEHVKEVKAKEMASKAQRSPWEGWHLQGWPQATFLEGRLAYAHRDLVRQLR